MSDFQDFAHAYENRGTTYNILQRYNDAIQNFNQAIRILPKDSQFHLKRGNSYNYLKQYQQAIRDYTEAIRLKPDNIAAHRLRAEAEDASGDGAGLPRTAPICRNPGTSNLK